MSETNAVLDRVTDQEYADLAQTGSAPPLPVSPDGGPAPMPPGEPGRCGTSSTSAAPTTRCTST